MKWRFIGAWMLILHRICIPWPPCLLRTKLSGVWWPLWDSIAAQVKLWKKWIWMRLESALLSSRSHDDDPITKFENYISDPTYLTLQVRSIYSPAHVNLCVVLIVYKLFLILKNRLLQSRKCWKISYNHLLYMMMITKSKPVSFWLLMSHAGFGVSCWLCNTVWFIRHVAWALKRCILLSWRYSVHCHIDMDSATTMWPRATLLTSDTVQIQLWIKRPYQLYIFPIAITDRQKMCHN